MFAVTRFVSHTEPTKHTLSGCESVVLPTTVGDAHLSLRAATLYAGDATNGHHVAVVRADEGYYLYDDTSAVVELFGSLDRVPQFAQTVNLLFYEVVAPPPRESLVVAVSCAPSDATHATEINDKLSVLDSLNSRRAAAADGDVCLLLTRFAMNF